jgi:hypothetical protein
MALAMAREQLVTWNMAGAKGLAMIPELGGELEGQGYPPWVVVVSLFQ